MKKKVSDIVVEFFESKKVKDIFLLSGGMMMHLLDSIGKSKKINYVCNHHEQASIFAAESYSRVTNKIGVCFATSGPGSTNTVTGLASAWVDSTPLFVITGQSSSKMTSRGAGIEELRMIGTFEVDIVSIVKPITKYSYFINDPIFILFHLEKAYQEAISGRPGPVLLDIPLDIQGALVDEEKLIKFQPEFKENISNNNFDALKIEIEKSKKPLIIAGHGIRVSNQVSQFLKMTKKFNIPVVSTQLANDVIPYENDLFIGKVGLRGDRAGNYAVQNADLIITIGSSLHITTTGYNIQNFAKNAKVINIDIDDGLIKKNNSIVNIQFKINLKDFFEIILNSQILKSKTNWNSELLNLKYKFQVISEPHTKIDKTVNTYFLVDFLSKNLGEGNIIIYDSGSLYYIVGQTFKSKIGQKIVTPGGLGTMGYALPASTGASIAFPSKNIICLVGDGSVHTNIHELAVISHHKLNIKIIIVNNCGYASIRNTQNSFMDGNIVASSSESGVEFPNWEIISKSYSIPYLLIRDEKELESILDKNLNKNGPFVFEVIVPPVVELMPSVVSTKNKNGTFKSDDLDQMSPKL